MNLELKHLDVNGWQALEDYIPELAENFIVTLSLRIGPSNEEGSHEYGLTVCSSKRLSHIIDSDGPVFGRHMLILNRYDIVEIMRSINEMIEKCSRPTFEESSSVLARFFSWEYEDYKN